MGLVTTSPLPFGGSPTILSEGHKQKRAHKWADWLNHPCRLGGRQHFTTEDKIRSCPQVGLVATSPLPFRCPQRFREVDKKRSDAQVGKLAISPRPSWGSPTLQSGAQNQKGPTSGLGGYITLAVLGVPNASERGTKSEVAHKWGDWLHQPWRLGGPQRLRAGDKHTSGSQVSKLAISPLPFVGSPMLHCGVQNRKGPQIGLVATSPCRLGVPDASERGLKIGVAHKWAENGYTTRAVWGSPTLHSG